MVRKFVCNFSLDPTYSCWIRMPTGCGKTLEESDTPDKWFIDPRCEKLGCTRSVCEYNRRRGYNQHCSRMDVLGYYGFSPPGNKSEIKSRYSKTIRV